MFIHLVVLGRPAPSSFPVTLPLGLFVWVATRRLIKVDDKVCVVPGEISTELDIKAHTYVWYVVHTDTDSVTHTHSHVCLTVSLSHCLSVSHKNVWGVVLVVVGKGHTLSLAVWPAGAAWWTKWEGAFHAAATQAWHSTAPFRNLLLHCLRPQTPY